MSALRDEFERAKAAHESAIAELQENARQRERELTLESERALEEARELARQREAKVRDLPDIHS